MIQFLRCQAADMTFGPEEAQTRIQELSRTEKVENFLGPDPYAWAIVFEDLVQTLYTKGRLHEK